ncbi:hypothetical protein ACHAO7_011110 [Fusarium culmorum]
MDLGYQPLVTNNDDAMLYPDLERYWATDQTNFSALYEACDKNVQHEYNDTSFASNYTYTPASDDLTGCVFSEVYPPPSQDPDMTSPEVSPERLDGRQRSPLTQSTNRRKRRPTKTDREPTKSYQHTSSKQVQTKGATGDVCGDAKGSQTLSNTTERNLSTLQYLNGEQHRKRQERIQCASYKYRNRQRETQKDLEAVEKDMEQLNHYLSRCVTDLKDEVWNLKMMVLQHTHCDCLLIQEYIANHANRFIQELEDRRKCQQPEQYCGK